MRFLISLGCSKQTEHIWTTNTKTYTSQHHQCESVADLYKKNILKIQFVVDIVDMLTSKIFSIYVQQTKRDGHAN